MKWKANYEEKGQQEKLPLTNNKSHEDTIPKILKFKNSNNFYICHKQ